MILENSLKISYSNIRCCRSNFVGCEHFLELNIPDILAFYETIGYLPLIRNGSLSFLNFIFQLYYNIFQLD